MMILVTGGSKCGKSSFAEKALDDFTVNKYYLATMLPFGEDADRAIERHREMRKNKNFRTIEKYTDIDEITLPEGSVLLLECLGNLCANEMFSGGTPVYPVDKIVKGLMHLRDITEKLVIVTNEVGSDGIEYEAGTMKYISAMSELNRRTAQLADAVIECVCGIPIVLKGDKLC